MYEPENLTHLQRSIDRHLTQDSHRPYSIIRDQQFLSLCEKLKAARKSLKKSGKGNKTTCYWTLEAAESNLCGLTGYWEICHSRIASKLSVAYAHIALGLVWKRWALQVDLWQIWSQKKLLSKKLLMERCMLNWVKIPEHFKPKCGAHLKTLINVRFDCLNCMWVSVPVITAKLILHFTWP